LTNLLADIIIENCYQLSTDYDGPGSVPYRTFCIKVCSGHDPANW
jgi:hypothetical protein